MPLVVAADPTIPNYSPVWRRPLILFNGLGREAFSSCIAFFSLALGRFIRDGLKKEALLVVIFTTRVVDCPTQLVCIWIYICQHTKKT